MAATNTRSAFISMCCTVGLNWKWEGKELDQLSIDLLQAWKPRVKGDFASLDFENWMEVLHRLGSWECWQN